MKYYLIIKQTTILFLGLLQEDEIINSPEKEEEEEDTPGNGSSHIKSRKINSSTQSKITERSLPSSSSSNSKPGT